MTSWQLSAAAEQDLSDVFLFGMASFGATQAEKYRREIERTLDLLATFPEMAHERPEFDPPVRVHHHGWHYIAYNVRSDHVLIVRIVRDDADLDSLFGPF